MFRVPLYKFCSCELCALYSISVVDSTIHNLNSTNETTSTTTPLPLPKKKFNGIARNPRVALATAGGFGPLDPPGQLAYAPAYRDI